MSRLFSANSSQAFYSSAGSSRRAVPQQFANLCNPCAVNRRFGIMEDYDDVSHDSDSDIESPGRLTSLSGGGKTTGQLASRQMKPVDTVLFEQYDRNANPAVVPIQVEPKVINFDSISPGILYVMTFSVRNSSFIRSHPRACRPCIEARWWLLVWPEEIIRVVEARIVCNLFLGSSDGWRPWTNITSGVVI